MQACNDGGVELWMSNDTLNEVTDTLTIRFGTFANGTVWEESSQLALGMVLHTKERETA